MAKNVYNEFCAKIMKIQFKKQISNKQQVTTTRVNGKKVCNS